VAKKLAAKEALKKQLELLKKDNKKLLITELLYKKASDYFIKAVKVDIAVEGERSKMSQMLTRKINLPSRYII
jgi:hypothetical protein